MTAPIAVQLLVMDEADELMSNDTMAPDMKDIRKCVGTQPLGLHGCR